MAALGANCLLTSAKVLFMEKRDEGAEVKMLRAELERGTRAEDYTIIDHSWRQAGQSRTRLPGFVLALLR
jgi:hypothetical protein